MLEDYTREDYIREGYILEDYLREAICLRAICLRARGALGVCARRALLQQHRDRARDGADHQLVHLLLDAHLRGGGALARPRPPRTAPFHRGGAAPLTSLCACSCARVCDSHGSGGLSPIEGRRN